MLLLSFLLSFSVWVFGWFFKTLAKSYSEDIGNYFFNIGIYNQWIKIFDYKIIECFESWDNVGVLQLYFYKFIGIIVVIFSEFFSLWLYEMSASKWQRCRR